MIEEEQAHAATDGEKSNRVSPRRHQLRKFQNQGINIKDSKPNKYMMPPPALILIPREAE